MTDAEIMYMLVVLVLMSEEHFKECTDYVELTDMTREERCFMERVIFVAGMKRKERESV